MAETSASEQPGATQTAPTPDAGAGPSADEARGWAGSQLDDIGGAGAGKVDGVLVDAQSGRPEWLVVRAGRLGQRTLVPARHAVGAAGHVWVPYERETIRGAPRGDGSRGLTRADEERLLAHYGVGAGTGRAADLASREPAAVTATPAR